MAFIMEFRTTCKPRRERNKFVSQEETSVMHIYMVSALHMTHSNKTQSDISNLLTMINLDVK